MTQERIEIAKKHGDTHRIQQNMQRNLNAAYIAACSNNAEAGWHSTRGMIQTINTINVVVERGQPGFAVDSAIVCRDALLEVVLAQWPLESLLQTAEV
jgi:hypothetical protein